MNLVNLFEGRNDADHFDALHRTGFFGSQGAGCIILAQDTGRILICHRSEDVQEPGTWGVWGGAIDNEEDPRAAAIREVREECGYSGPISAMEPLYIFSKGSFSYYNFLAIVQKEFTPHLDWESQGFRWCQFGRWPKPLHFGLVSLFSDGASVDKIKAAIAQCRPKAPTQP